MEQALEKYRHIFDRISASENNFPKNFRAKYKYASKELKRFVEVRGNLKRRGIIRSNKSFPSDYFEWVVCKSLNLIEAKNLVQEGWDAEKDGKKFQIKAREEDSNPSFDFKKIKKGDFDYLIGVVYSIDDFSLKTVIMAPFNFVKRKSNKNKSGPRFRLNTKMMAVLRQKGYIIF